MANESIRNGNPETTAMNGISPLQGGLDETARLELFQDEGFGEEDKLALLSFLMQEFGLKLPVVLTGVDSSASARFLIEQHSQQHTKIDLLYLDMQALRGSSPVITRLFGLLSRRGVIYIEASAAELTNGVIPTETFETVLVTPGFSIFAHKAGERPIRSMRYQVDLFCRKLVFERKRRSGRPEASDLPLIAVVVLTYKHENYIAECLQSVLCQQGRFRMRVVIIDDASPDGTTDVVRSVISGHQNDRCEIQFHANQKNAGVVANLATSMRLVKGCDYLTFCEGDDFWISEYRLQKHIEFLAEHPECAMSFNSIELSDAEGTSRKVFEVHHELDSSELEGVELAEDNFIGNFTACFYRGELINLIPFRIFEIYTVDWFFNLYCSQFGKIGHLKEVLSVYRQHAGGEWSSRRTLDKALELLRLISQYDEFLDYQYDEAFQRYSKNIYGTVDHAYSGKEGRLDLLVVDDVFPSSRSGFRYSELTSYLRTFQKSLVLASGKNLHVIEKNSINKVIRSYRRKFPTLGSKVVQHDGGFPLRLANVVYVNFLSNAYALLREIEAGKVPFVFTLYPGAGFVLNDSECDSKLKRVFNSPCFQKVIVTQQVTYDYIIDRDLCPASKVQMIFGVVMPEIPGGQAYSDKRRWGFGKSRLDICFMAHKYTPNGEDKGYDVFVNVASILRQRYDDIYFHVAGPFDQHVIDVSTFSDRIKFHGSLPPEEFDNFFGNMDLILSPNISGKIFPGSFDGFPTASCTEAGLRGVAIFAVDEFNSAKGHYTDGEDIVLVRYDLGHIIDQIEKYYADPASLKAVGERSIRRIRELYCHEAQMTPRIELLRQVIREPVVPTYDINTLPDMPPAVPIAVSAQPISPAMRLLRKTCPKPIKQLYRAWKRNYGSY